MKVKELQVIDSHFHFCDFPGFDQVALAAGYTNTEESLHQAFIENNVVHGVVMSNRTLDAKKHNYPDYMSYCIGIDSLTAKDDMDSIAANVEENLKISQCCGIKLYPGYSHIYVYDEWYDPIYELAEKYDKPVAIHTGLTATANALLKYGQDADGALRVLEPVTNDSRAFFPMAVAYNMKGDWRKAEELIKKAGMAQGKQKLSGEPGDGGNNQQIEM